MKQLNWNYFDANSKRYVIGMLHGQKTGHFVVHINTKVSIIDFKVLEPKIYKLFIGQELIELKIDKIDNEFKYELIIDRDAQTPHNIARKKLNKKHKWQTIAFFTLLIVTIIGLAFYFSS